MSKEYVKPDIRIRGYAIEEYLMNSVSSTDEKHELSDGGAGSGESGSDHFFD